MIKSRKCSLCNRPAFSKGLCQIHQAKKSIKQNREATKEKTAVKQDKRKTYFEYHLERCTRSEESFKQISEPTRANICHILPKRKYISVQNNLLNFIYLDLEEHSRFDLLLDSLRFLELEVEFPNSWGLACKRINMFIDDVEENGIIIRELKKYLNEKDL